MAELYIYKCKACGFNFEIFHLLSEPVHEIICPECGSNEVIRIRQFEHTGALPKKKKDKRNA